LLLYAETWKCSDGNVTEFEKAWTSEIFLERHWYALFSFSLHLDELDLQSALKCTCRVYRMHYISNRPSWNPWCTFKASSISIVFSFLLLYCSAVVCWVSYCWEVKVNTEAEVTEFKILAAQRLIAAACCQQTHALRFSSNSACETLVCITESSQFTVNWLLSALRNLQKKCFQ